MSEPFKTEVFFHNTDTLTSPWPYVVAAGGRSRVTHRDGMVSRQYHEHTLILTLSGRGCIKVVDGVVDCRAGCLAWLDTSKKYGHGAPRGHDWHYVWVALSGYGLDRLHEMMDLPDRPVLEDVAHLRPCFDEIVRILSDRPASADAAMTAQVARIVSDLYARRQPAVVGDRSDPISRVMRSLRADISRTWDISAMSDIAGLSPSQLFRRFKAICGTSPKSWLRQERLLLARHLLTATSDDISMIATRCGYADPFYFSRDFKHQTGCAPREFRAREVAGPVP